MGWKDYWIVQKKRFPVRVFFYRSVKKPEYYFLSVNSTGAYQKVGWYHIKRIEKFKNFYSDFEKQKDLHLKVFIFHEDIVGSILRYHALFNHNPNSLKDQSTDNEWIKGNTKEIIDYTK